MQYRSLRIRYWLLTLVLVAGTAIATDARAQTRSPERAIQNNDVNGDGKLSPDEFPRSRQIFRRIDKDRDGFLTAEEFAGHWTRMGVPFQRSTDGPNQANSGNQAGQGAPGRSRSGADIPAPEQVIRRLDTNGDGRIGRSEWRRDDRRFRQNDRDGDGFISLDEMTQTLARRAAPQQAGGNQPSPTCPTTGSAGSASTVSHGLPATGVAVSCLSEFDKVIPALMKKWGVPGATFALALGNRLVLARGYGYADSGTRQPVRPGSLFRIGSVSKPVTAVAVMKLIEGGKLKLSDRVMDLLYGAEAKRIFARDPRYLEITVANLLEHSGGMDTNRHNPMFEDLPASSATCDPAIKVQIGMKLNYQPGTRFIYSGVGYCLLGKVIEKVSGEDYETFVRESILKPIGAVRMQVGEASAAKRAENEVKYYTDESKGVYDAFTVRGRAPAGGWIASASDLVRFGTALGGRGGAAGVLSPETIASMIARPDLEYWEGKKSFYAKGWFVQPGRGGDARWMHNGAITGTYAVLERINRRLVWAILFNSKPGKDGYKPFVREVSRSIRGTIRKVAEWPSHDLFLADAR